MSNIIKRSIRLLAMVFIATNVVMLLIPFYCWMFTGESVFWVAWPSPRSGFFVVSVLVFSWIALWPVLFIEET
jgi:hypothetical protein